MVGPMNIRNKPNPELLQMSDQQRADLAVALLISLSGAQSLELIFTVLARVEDHVDGLIQTEFEKEC